MFFVEGELAPAIVFPRRCRRAGGRSAPEMHHFDARDEQDFPAPRADRGTEIDVLGVHEVPLVEPSHRISVGPADQQAGAADPVGILRLTGERLYSGAARQPFLPQLVPW